MKVDPNMKVTLEGAESVPKFDERSNSQLKGKSSISDFNSTPINCIEGLRQAYLPRGNDPRRFKRRAGSQL
jgi:hypothetical protein